MINNMKALRFWAIKMKKKIWFNGLKIFASYSKNKREMAVNCFMF